MIRAKQILVPYDFSVQSENAFKYASRIVDLLGAETIHVVHADILHHAPFVPDVPGNGREKFLLTKLREAVPSTNLQAKLHGAVIRDIRVATALLGYIEDHDIDLVVMGTHGRRGIRHMLLGSAAEEMVQTSPCPVLTVRNDAKGSGESLPKTLLVPIDFSENARSALLYAKEMSNRFGADLMVMHVLQDTYYPTFYSPLIKSIYEIDPDIEEKVRIKLNEFVLTTPGPTVNFTIAVGYGHPVEEINEIVKQGKADLIVMSTHGLTNMEHFLMGSVAEKVVRLANCPVFTIKSFGKSLVIGETADTSSEK